MEKAHIQEAFRKGDKVMAFDSSDWHKSGGDYGDNSRFWKKAEVLKMYWYDAKLGTSDWVVDVRFECGRVSNGHFLSGIKRMI